MHVHNRNTDYAGMVITLDECRVLGIEDRVKVVRKLSSKKVKVY